MMRKIMILGLICGLLLFLLTGSAFAIIDKIEAPRAGEDFDHAVMIEDTGYYFIANDLPTERSGLITAYVGYYKFTPNETGEYSIYGKCIVGFENRYRVDVYDKYQEKIGGTSEKQFYAVKEELNTVQLTAGYTYYIKYMEYSYHPEEIKADLAICSPTRHAIPGVPGEKCEVCGNVIEETVSFSFQPTPTAKPANTESELIANDTYQLNLEWPAEGKFVFLYPDDRFSWEQAISFGLDLYAGGFTVNDEPATEDDINSYYSVVYDHPDGLIIAGWDWHKLSDTIDVLTQSGIPVWITDTLEMEELRTEINDLKSGKAWAVSKNNPKNK